MQQTAVDLEAWAGEEKVWVEAEATPAGNVVLSLADVRKRRDLVERMGRHNAYVRLSQLKNFPPQFVKDLRKGRPVRFKMYQSAYESLM